MPTQSPPPWSRQPLPARLRTPRAPLCLHRLPLCMRAGGTSTRHVNTCATATPTAATATALTRAIAMRAGATPGATFTGATPTLATRAAASHCVDVCHCNPRRNSCHIDTRHERWARHWCPRVHTRVCERGRAEWAEELRANGRGCAMAGMRKGAMEGKGHQKARVVEGACAHKGWRVANSVRWGGMREWKGLWIDLVDKPCNS